MLIFCIVLPFAVFLPIFQLRKRYTALQISEGFVGSFNRNVIYAAVSVNDVRIHLKNRLVRVLKKALPY